MSNGDNRVKKRATPAVGEKLANDIDIEERTKVIEDARTLIQTHFDGNRSKAIAEFHKERNIKSDHSSSINKMFGSKRNLETVGVGTWDLMISFIEFVRDRGSRGIANTFDADQIQTVFSELNENDSITIISADGFIEAHEIPFRHHVVKNLSSGCTYKYVFPTKRLLSSKNDFVQLWDEICRSRSFGRHIAGVEIYGIGISPDTFEYFSPISRVVIHEKKHGGGVLSSIAYSFIRIKSRSGDTTLWYALSDSIRDKIIDRLDSSTKSLANYCVKFPDHIYAANTMQIRYAAAFANSAFCEEYRNLADVIRNEHLIPKIVETFSLKYRCHPHHVEAFDWLDLGCGDGQIAFEIASKLNVANRDMRLVGLDYSQSQTDALRSNIAENPLKVEVRTEDANTASLGDQYDLITVIHSIYALDPNVLYKLNSHLKPNGICLIYMANPDDDTHSFAALQAKAIGQVPSLMSSPHKLFHKLRNMCSHELDIVSVPRKTIEVDKTCIPQIAGFFALSPASSTSENIRVEVSKLVSDAGFRIHIDDCIIAFSRSDFVE